MCTPLDGSAPEDGDAGGEPVMRPSFAPGDLAGTYRCPAVVEIIAPPWFDVAQERWGWRTPVAVLAAVRGPDDAPYIEEAGIPRVALGRQSRLRLRPEQFAGAAAVPRACRPRWRSSDAGSRAAWRSSTRCRRLSTGRPSTGRPRRPLDPRRSGAAR